MEHVRVFAHLSSIVAFPQPLHYATKLKKRSFRIAAKFSGGDDPLLQPVIHTAVLRFQESHRPEPLFHDPYVACLVPENTPVDVKQQTHPYCIATRFIDDKLLQALRNTDELKQIVLLTDGVDTRPYRLAWPSSTLIFDVSPDRIHMEACQKLKAVGAQIPRTCLLLHVPLETSSTEGLRNKGFNGSRPSIWVLQGLPLMTLASFEDVLLTVGNLAMKGSFLIGEIPAWLAETQPEMKQPSQEEWLHKLFMSHGFQVQMIDYENVARSLSRKPLKKNYNNILFVAEHLRFSDDQMETWRREFQRAEDEGDEDGFEDL